jgi:hypothetical protein
MAENIFFYFGDFVQAAKLAKWPKERVEEVLKDAQSGDYKHALEVLFAAHLELGEVQTSTTKRHGRSDQELT